jgi:hypothetical protein
VTQPATASLAITDPRIIALLDGLSPEEMERLNAALPAAIEELRQKITPSDQGEFRDSFQEKS